MYTVHSSIGKWFDDAAMKNLDIKPVESKIEKKRCWSTVLMTALERQLSRDIKLWWPTSCIPAVYQNVFLQCLYNLPFRSCPRRCAGSTSSALDDLYYKRRYISYIKKERLSAYTWTLLQHIWSDLIVVDKSSFACAVLSFSYISDRLLLWACGSPVIFLTRQWKLMSFASSLLTLFIAFQLCVYRVKGYCYIVSNYVRSGEECSWSHNSCRRLLPPSKLRPFSSSRIYIRAPHITRI